MKLNPPLSDYSPAMVTACEAALDAGVFYHERFVDFVLAHMGGFDCQAVLIETAHLEAQASDYCARKRVVNDRLLSMIMGAPRGHYAAIHVHRADGPDRFEIVVSDGYGDGPAPGWRNVAREELPGSEEILRRMLGYEIYLCRHAVERKRQAEANRSALLTLGFSTGDTFRDVTIGADKFSTGVITLVHPESGTAKLLLTRRGSKLRFTATLGAAELAHFRRQCAESQIAAAGQPELALA